MGIDRPLLIRRGLHLGYATLAYNSAEAAVALAAGIAAGSVVLVGFGADSVIELTAGLAALWRLHADVDAGRRGAVERTSRRVIGACFVTLALYVAVDAGRSLVERQRPGESTAGLVLAAASLVTMPILAGGKRRVARGIGSGALASEARQTLLCGYLSAILLSGLLLNALLGWWWADPVAALAMVPIIAREGIEGLRWKDGGPDPCCS